MDSYKAYPSRFFILTIVALLSSVQAIVWMSFSPIADEGKEWYGLTDVDLTLLPTYDPICFIALLLPFTWLLHKAGLRLIGLSSAWMLAIGCSIRCLVPYVPDASKWIWLMHIGHVMIGCVSIPVMSISPKVTSVWFKPKERTFATAVAITGADLGFAVGFILNPLITQLYGVRTMLIVHAELSVFVALLFTIYFPSGPPTPPSASAEEDRTSFLISFKKLITNYPFILLVISCGVIFGVNFGFQSVLTVILNPSLGFNDKVIVHSVDEFFYSTSWMGAMFSFIGALGAQLTGFFADRFQRKFKFILMGFVGVAFAFSVWFSLSIYGWGSSNPINLFISYSMLSLLLIACLPIYYEAGVEGTYPVTENVSAGVISLSINVGILTFAIIGMAGVFSDEHPERAKAMSLAISGAALIAIVCLFFYQENYKRLSVDTNVANTTSVLKENHKDDQHKSRVKEERLLLLNPGQPINAKIIRT